MKQDNAAAALHELVAQILTNLLTEGREVLSKDGEVVNLGATPSDIKNAITFLKNNEITFDFENVKEGSAPKLLDAIRNGEFPVVDPEEERVA